MKFMRESGLRHHVRETRGRKGLGRLTLALVEELHGTFRDRKEMSDVLVAGEDLFENTHEANEHTFPYRQADVRDVLR
jgi:hypothetical protein